MSNETVETHKLAAVPSTASIGSESDGSAVCDACFGTGMEIVPGKGARPCGCRQQTESSHRFEKIRVPKRYDGCHFNNYSPENFSQREACALAMSFTNEFPAV